MNSRCEDIASFYSLNADLYVTPPQQTNSLLRRQGGTKGGGANDKIVQQRSGEIEEEDNESDQLVQEPERQTAQLREKEGVYFDNQIGTKATPIQQQKERSSVTYSTNERQTKRPARVRETYGARVRASNKQTQQTSKVRDYDNWASASEEDSRAASKEVEFVTINVPTTTTAAPPNTTSTTTASSSSPSSSSSSAKTKTNGITTTSSLIK